MQNRQNKETLRKRFLAETNAFLTWCLSRRPDRTVAKADSTTGTLITVPRAPNGEIDARMRFALRRRLENLLACRAATVMLDMDGLHRPDEELRKLVSEFQARFSAVGRQLYVLDA